jgi:hypothetical protein
MKWFSSALFSALFFLSLASCTQDAHYTVAATFDNRILVSQDKETMERMIECAITRRCEGLSIMELLPSRKVFFVESGTKVVIKGGFFSFSDARRVHILQGPHHDEDCWVYDRMLYQDQGNAPYQLAFASMYQSGGR